MPSPVCTPPPTRLYAWRQEPLCQPHSPLSGLGVLFRDISNLLHQRKWLLTVECGIRKPQGSADQEEEGKQGKKRSAKTISGLQGEMLSSLTHASAQGSGSTLSSLFGDIFSNETMNNDRPAYGPNTKHTHHFPYSPQQPDEADTVAVCILWIRDRAERGRGPCWDRYLVCAGCSGLGA